ncbi:hypothetical protein [Nodosilinea sp. P-1105]|uniref:hypothetical protein n=1 Tax=Nodosilinea sp. P-1105 TaxID=2546229 RepID=UPI00146ACD9C|nr:hypothetical protein [Nodosilinea sp. P-1105]NMF85593.1 hypothetical protein [Nodosilinea sp. P-1105]
MWWVSLRRRLADWAVPDPYVTTVEKQLSEAIDNWQTDPEASNNLVLFSSPVDDTDALLERVIQSAIPEGIEVRQPLSWHQRPEDVQSIAEQFRQALADVQAEAKDIDTEVDDPDTLAQRRVMIVMPPLEQCFLRCIGGWQGVEWLRDTVGQQPQYFWLIRCNTWAWGFLNRVCQVGAYFNCQVRLPELDKAQLASWLIPFAQRLQTETDNQAETKDEDGDGERDFEDWSWGTLADLSMGSAAVAKALWLQSLRLREIDWPETIVALEDHWPVPVPLQQLAPTLPGLPDLEAEDNYVIHALMLHGPMSRSHLALSLGQGESVVQVRVQMLRQAGVIQVNHQGLSIAPAHYPKLCAQLSNNNFLTGED